MLYQLLSPYILIPLLMVSASIAGYALYQRYTCTTELARVETHLNAQRQLFESLIAVARAAGEQTILQITLQRTLDTSIKLTGAEQGSIFILNEQGNVTDSILVRSIATLDEKQQLVRNVMHEGLAGWVARHKQPAMIHDSDQDDRWLPLPNAPYSVRSVLAIPMMQGSLVVGILTLIHSLPAHFHEEHLELMQAIGDQMALAVRNAQMYDQQQRMHDQLSLLNEALQSSVNGIIITDSNGIMVWVNEAFCHTTGYTAEEVLHQPTSMLKSGMHNDTFYQNLWRAITSGHTWHGELTSRRKNGTYYTEEMTITPVQDTSGNITHFVAIKADITERKHMERELTLAREAAEHANRTKSQFLANMSHELRTPLNAIIGYSEMLKDEASYLEYQDALPDLEKIHSAGHHLLSLINDVLDISRIEAGKIDVTIEEFDVALLIDHLIHTAAPMIAKNNNTLIIERDPAVKMMYADQKKAHQIIYNLLSNAAKFTEQGTITLTTHYVQSEHPLPTLMPLSHIQPAIHNEWIVIQVTDTGIGMTHQQMDRLFELFSQGDSSTTRKYGGTGIGLALSYRFCRMMQGVLHVESTIEVGSTFTVCLPKHVQPITLEQSFVSASIVS